MDCTPPDFILPGAKDRPLLPLHPSVNDLKVGLFFSSQFFWLEILIDKLFQYVID